MGDFKALHRADAAPVAAVCAAAAVPSLVMGPAAIGVAIAPAALAVALTPLRAAAVQALRLAVRAPLGRLVILVFVLWLPSLAGSVDPRLSTEAWLRALAFVTGALILWQALASRSVTARLMPPAVLIASAIAAATALAALYGTSEVLSLVRFQGWRPRDAALSLKAFADAGMLLIPVALWAGWRLGGLWRAVAVATTIALLLVIDATTSRAAWAGVLAMAAAAVLILVWQRRSPAVVAGAAVALAVLVAAGVAFLLDHPRPPRTVEFTTYLPVWLVDLHRQAIWSFTWDHFLSAPLFGVGLNALNHVAGASRIVPGLNTETLPSHPHNWLLEVLAETGIVGALPLLAAVAVAFWMLLRDHLRSGSACSLTAVLVSVGYWFSGLFNFSFWAAWWQLAYLTLMVVVLATRDARAPGGSP